MGALHSRFEINAEAVANRNLSDVEDSPYTYSNVSFRRLNGDQVALGFDVTRHMEVVEPAGSDLVNVLGLDDTEISRLREGGALT